MTFKVIDMHTAGEPLRVIVEGVPPLQGRTILEKRRYMKDHADWVRTALMFEPRGHADMYGAILTEPETDDGDFGVLFLHNEGYSTMCGHGIIALTKLVLEDGLLSRDDNEVRFDTPAGRVTAWGERSGGKVAETYFRNVPSFAVALDREVLVGGIGAISYDLAFGGAYYAYVQAPLLGLNLVPDEFRRIIELGREIKHEVAAQENLSHPERDDIGFLYGVIFVGPALEGNHSRNVCVFADGEVDRSPTGTGVSGRAAIHMARGELQLGEQIVIESILGTTFSVSAVGECRVGEQAAIVPEVRGSAYITGRAEFVLEEGDPLLHGFLLR